MAGEVTQVWGWNAAWNNPWPSGQYFIRVSAARMTNKEGAVVVSVFLQFCLLLLRAARNKGLVGRLRV